MKVGVRASTLTALPPHTGHFFVVFAGQRAAMMAEMDIGRHIMRIRDRANRIIEGARDELNDNPEEKSVIVKVLAIFLGVALLAAILSAVL